ncbi:hypothetical protein AB0B89_28185 [Sphaerisporangium sp. NPDC049002]|uniref:hypothetical protein n=1 Tax=Sphaerisporangium sp. NPDC049002 TaxID=3155392 RepID=UPI0033C5BAF7
MSIVRRIRAGAAATMIGAVSIIAFAAQPAHADVVESTCTYGYNLSVNQITATCTTYTATPWYMRVMCETPRDTFVYVNGTIVWNSPGRGTSLARCPVNTEIHDWTFVNV